MQDFHGDDLTLVKKIDADSVSIQIGHMLPISLRPQAAALGSKTSSLCSNHVFSVHLLPNGCRVRGIRLIDHQ